MKKFAIIFVLLTISLLTGAQVVFQTFVTSEPVVEGESFRIQFILEERPGNEFSPPDFRDFRLVSGPIIYPGTIDAGGEPMKLQNISYTLEAVKPGAFRIAGATARVEGRNFKSNEVKIVVISKQEAAQRGLEAKLKESNSAAYFLQPGEDPYQKIRKNLFLKVMVDKRSCFVGEPVTATFKLYSRLVSRSDIVKNPGFYGFTVQDIIGLNDKQSAIETVNGKKFNVHKVRKVQLYPLQAGQFTIDPMEVISKVDFSRSMVYKKSEQEITEGVYLHEPEVQAKNIETFESSMNSGSVDITVKPLPTRNRPADYNGATGNFAITAGISKNKLGKNEEGELIITVSGKGNFTQLVSPVIRWPEGVEGFEVKVKDELNHDQAPMKGKRVFHFPFISSKVGQHIFPSISFSFFDPDSNHYKTVVTKPVVVTVANNGNSEEEISGSGNIVTRRGYILPGIAGLLILFAGIGGWIIWKRKSGQDGNRAKQGDKDSVPLVAAIMQPAAMVVKSGNKEFYTRLRQCIWNFFSIHFGLKGSEMSMQRLKIVMQQKNVDEKSQETILEILQQCETGMFADADIETDRMVLLSTSTNILEKIASRWPGNR